MDDNQKSNISDSTFLEMTTEIVSSFLNNNKIDSSEIPKLISDIYDALKLTCSDFDAPKNNISKPAVSIKRSVTPDFIVCLEDGRKLKMLKRYLRAAYNMTPDQYRQKWKLPSDYPMVAPNYAKRRSDFAKKTGFGKGKAYIKS